MANKDVAGQKPPFFEFVAMMAMMSALAALSIDAMLPALPKIAEDLNFVRVNDSQLVIAFLFVGMAIGPILFGPLSDSIGRKQAVTSCFILFIVGTALCYFSDSFLTMMLGRILQGAGASGSRSVSMAIIRDAYSGTDMARVLSFVTAVFILVPILAPALGQAILIYYDWRTIFFLFFAIAILVWLWFSLRQAETLSSDQRIPFSVTAISSAFSYVLSRRRALAYVLCLGFLFGGFIAYISLAQKLFQEVYTTGNQFPYYFAGLALGFGLAALANARLVNIYGLDKLVRIGISSLVFISAIYVAYCFYCGGKPPVYTFVAYLLASFSCIAISFNNLTALAMDGLKDMAGMGSAIVSTISTIISVAVGTAIGQMYDFTVNALVVGFTFSGGITLIILYFSRTLEDKSWDQREEGTNTSAT